MNYLKYTQYVYLAFAGYFIYDGISKWGQEDKPTLSFIIAGLAIFMFFFRRRFAKKFEDHKKQQ
jgi:hypothetical protein